MHGAGNDFLVVRGEEREWPALAPALCDRRRGVGGDGVLVALPSRRADVRMRMYNPDGTEDDCGNGLRCLALYARERGLVAEDCFRVETLSGIKRVAVEDAAARPARVRVELGRARLEPEAVPVRSPGRHALGIDLEAGGRRLQAHVLSTGTAHTVIFEMPDDGEFRRLSPLIEHHPLFPERTTVMWTAVTGPDRLRVRIWERGVGETLACGTGAAAAAVAAHRAGHCGHRVQVESHGGTLHVVIGGELDLSLIGPAEWVYDGEIPAFAWSRTPQSAQDSPTLR